MDLFETIFRWLLAWIDRVVAWLIVQAYNLFEILADLNIFSKDSGAIKIFNNRIYALLAIFMLFKLAFSLITYVINPEDFTDKNKGAGKLITNVFVVLLLLVSVPKIFELAFDFQGLIIKNNTINKLILGVGTNNFGEEVTPGHVMSYSVYTAFVTPNPDFQKNGQRMGDRCADLYTYVQQLSVDSTEVIPSSCKSIIESANPSAATWLKIAIGEYDVQALLHNDVIGAKNEGQFLFNYRPLISTITGGLVAWILIMFCFDVAIRVVKLGFLQLIAPIPIISYIDPKGAKDGMFKKWTKVCLSTYADLFVRLIAISFAIFIIGIISTSEMTKLSDETKTITIDNVGILQYAFIKIFIILGALLFAKQIPKLIEDLTGIKLDGKFTLNPMRKISESPFASAAIGGALGAGAGAIGAFSAKRATGGGVLSSVVSGAGGIFAGGARGVAGGLKSDGKGSPIKTGLEAGSLSGANILKRDGSRFGARMAARMGSAIGTGTEGDKIDKKIKNYEDLSKEVESIFKKANGEMIKSKYDSLSFKDNAGNNVTMRDFKTAKDYLNSLRNADTSKMNSSQLQDHLNEINDLQSNVAITEKLAEQAFVDAVGNGTYEDAEITARLTHLQNEVTDSKDPLVKSFDVKDGKELGKRLKDAKDVLKDKAITLEHDEKTIIARASRDAVKKSK